MNRWKEALRRLTYLTRRSRFHQELEDELRFHIESRADELVENGLPRANAIAQASREFGSQARVSEDTGSAWQFRWLEDLFGDLRYASRGFRRNPAFALTAIVCLALGIGANTTIFSIATEILFSQPSVRDPQTLVSIIIGGGSHSAMKGFTYIRDANIFASMAAENENVEANWRHGDATERLFAIMVTGNYFDVTGFPLAMGRPIEPGDSDVVVVSYGFWQSRLGADPQVIGRGLVLDGRPFTVAGVLPRDHHTLTGFGFTPDLYMPAGNDRQPMAFFARLPDGMTRQIALARLQATTQQLDRIYPHEGWADPAEISAIAGSARLKTNRGLAALAAFFAMLMIVVGLVLLIACANVASLLLARTSSRAHELAIRLSIGAGRGRIVRQLFAESLLLALLGTAAGLSLNLVLTNFLSRIRLPLPVPVQFLIRPDWKLLGYSVAIALATSVGSGLLPAIKGTRGINAALKLGERQIANSRWALRNVLVAGQLAVSIVLLSAAVLFMRNLVGASTRSPGFDVDHTAWAFMRLAPERYPSADRIRSLIHNAVERLRTVPGIEAATVVRVVPLNDAINFMMPVTTDRGGPSERIRWQGNNVGEDYFKTMRIPIVEGREFLATDGAGDTPVVILNQNMARRLFGNQSAIGHTIRLGNGKPALIAGVATNSKYMTLGEENAMAVYQPYMQVDGTGVNLHFLVRVSGSAQRLIPGIQTILNQLDPTAALEIRTMRNGLALALLPSRAGAIILGSMGLLGLALASIGLYGVLLYSVSRRIREIGLRVALGATPASVLKLVIRQSASLAGVGIAIGLTLSVFAVRPLAMFLTPEVRTTDASNFVIVAAALALVALIATVAPALRALRIDPVVALRHD